MFPRVEEELHHLLLQKKLQLLFWKRERNGYLFSNLIQTQTVGLACRVYLQRLHVSWKLIHISLAVRESTELRIRYYIQKMLRLDTTLYWYIVLLTITQTGPHCIQLCGRSIIFIYLTPQAHLGTNCDNRILIMRYRKDIISCLSEILKLRYIR